MLKIQGETFPIPERLIAETAGSRTRIWVPCIIHPEGDRLAIKTGFNRFLVGELKAFAGARWDPDRTLWTISDNERNRFQLAYLGGMNPYAPYDLPLVPYNTNRPLYAHQYEMVIQALTRHFTIFAAEMGTGKTLAAIEVMEASGFEDWFYVGPKSALAAATLEFRKWKSRITPKFFTYDSLKRIIAQWPEGTPPPRGIIFDESSRLKTPTSQRSLAANYLASAIRSEHGNAGFVILMSGSPAPKSPADWWYQCEVTKPGFIREGTYEKFKHRLGLIVQKDSITGGKYPHLVTWRDDENKCNICGEVKEDELHEVPEAIDVMDTEALGYHKFVPSVNEVAYLYERMKGLVLVKFKKDCLDLPDKQYRVINCKPTQALMNAARMITKIAPTTIQGLTLLRELSDGFQYEDVEVGKQDCPNCRGEGVVLRPVPIIDEDDLAERITAWHAELDRRPDDDATDRDDQGYLIPDHVKFSQFYEEKEIQCRHCGGKGEVPKYKRETKMVPCPKEEVLLEILDSHDDDGRLVVYGGFTGTIDRIIHIVEKAGWQYIKVDGRGWTTSVDGIKKPEDMLEMFQDKKRAIEKLIFIGQPSSAGMGLTLTESCEICYYSNDFNGESRLQSEDRIHRPGMDVNKGATITDLIHLPSDALVLENLKKKRKLQDMSLGVFKHAIETAAVTLERQF